jgi:hypothetical protein
MNQTSKKKAWRVKVKGKDELLTLIAQEVVVVQQPIAATNVISIHEMDIRLMPKVSPIHLLSSILQQSHPFLEICQRMLEGREANY